MFIDCSAKKNVDKYSQLYYTYSIYLGTHLHGAYGLSLNVGFLLIPENRN